MARMSARDAAYIREQQRQMGKSWKPGDLARPYQSGNQIVPRGESVRAEVVSVVNPSTVLFESGASMHPSHMREPTPEQVKAHEKFAALPAHEKWARMSTEEKSAALQRGGMSREHAAAPDIAGVPASVREGLEEVLAPKAAGSEAVEAPKAEKEEGPHEAAAASEKAAADKEAATKSEFKEIVREQLEKAAKSHSHFQAVAAKAAGAGILKSIHARGIQSENRAKLERLAETHHRFIQAGGTEAEAGKAIDSGKAAGQDAAKAAKNFTTGPRGGVFYETGTGGRVYLTKDR